MSKVGISIVSPGRVLTHKDLLAKGKILDLYKVSIKLFIPNRSQEEPRYESYDSAVLEAYRTIIDNEKVGINLECNNTKSRPHPASEIYYGFTLTLKELLNFFYDRFCGKNSKLELEILDDIAAEMAIVNPMIFSHLKTKCVNLGYCPEYKCCGHPYAIEREEFLELINKKETNIARGKLIVIEGQDGCGKATQTEELYKALQERSEYNGKVMKLTFPNYGKPQAVMVEEYLKGNIHKNPSDVNPYAASLFYATDRYVSSIKDKIEEMLDRGYTVISDRYTTSNMLFQSSKFNSDEDIVYFIKWLKDLEYDKLKIPVPDLVFYLSADVSSIMELLQAEDKDKDIHETQEFQNKVKRTAKFIVEKEKWIEVECVYPTGKFKSINDIHKIILAEVLK